MSNFLGGDDKYLREFFLGEKGKNIYFIFLTW